MAEQVWWAIKAAPVADVEEWAVLVAMAEAADQDGCNSFLSANTIAARTRLARRTVQRRMDDLEKRGLIRKGDQRVAAHIPADRRPVVYDVMVPYSHFRLDKITAEGAPVLSVDVWRDGRGKPPLRPQDRPEIAAPPEKKRRSDHGVKRPKAIEPDDVSPDDPEQDDAESTSVDGVTTSHHRDDYETSRGVSGSHPTLPSNPPHDPPRSAALRAATADPPVETSSSNDTFRNARGRDDAAAAGSSADHENGDATRAGTAPAAILEAMMLNPDESARFRAWLITATNATNPDGLIVTLHTSGRLSERLTQWRASESTQAAPSGAHGATPPATGRPAQLRWCGRCDQDTRMATVTDPDGRELLRRCPACNINAGRVPSGAGASQEIAQQVALAAANSTGQGRDAAAAARAGLPQGVGRRITTIGEPVTPKAMREAARAAN